MPAAPLLQYVDPTIRNRTPGYREHKNSQPNDQGQHKTISAGLFAKTLGANGSFDSSARTIGFDD
jgi:hypothetical protein